MRKLTFAHILVLSFCWSSGSVFAEGAAPMAEPPDSVASAAEPMHPAATLPLPAGEGWWKGFNDPLLDSLINMGEKNNYSLRQTLRKIEVARQAVRQTKSGYYPQFNTSFGYTRTRSSGYSTSASSKAMTSGGFQFGVDMSWQVDVFGRVQAQLKEAGANVRMSRAEYEAMYISLASEIASNYISLRTLQTELSVTKEHVAQEEKVLKITEARHEAGLSSKLDVAQAQTVYYSTLSSLSSLETQINTTINAIAVLTGQYPDQIMPLLTPYSPQPNGDWVVSTDIPMEWIENRPDVMEAKYNVESYAAAVGVTEKDWLPTLSLSASAGTSAWNIKDMFKKESYTYTIAPVIEWTVFDGFSRDAKIASAREQMMAAVDSYNETLLTAVQEVDNATHGYVSALKYEKEIELTLKYAQQAYSLAIDRYKQGLDAFINVSDALMTVLQYADELVVARGNVLQAIVDIAKSVGRL